MSFYTSSNQKYMQARLVFDMAGLRLSTRRQSGRAYHESYSGSKEQLIASAITEIQRREGGRPAGPFFIEDTSIRIDALSEADWDRPGLGAKEWFETVDFDDLDRILRERNNRRATVKSCIGLSIPGLERPLYFYGETRGEVANAPAIFEPNPFHPWLAPDNFSAWLIPDGADKTLSEMSLEESLNYDFRVQALSSLLDRLEEYAIVMNSPAPFFFRSHSPSAGQTVLFPLRQIQDSSTILVVGPTCSGKSTLGAYVQQTLGRTVMDASSVVRAIQREHGLDEIDVSEFAHKILASEGADFIARQIVDRYDSLFQEGLVITGFRAIQEIEYMRSMRDDITVISVEAPERVRYERYLARNTRLAISGIREFRAHDQRQHELGLLEVAGELADLRIENVYSLASYYNQVAHALGEERAPAPGVTHVKARLDPLTSQLYRCLVVLSEAAEPLTTQELQTREPQIRYNNANKMLKRYPALALRIEAAGQNVRYRITENGRAFIRAVDSRVVRDE